MELKAAESFFNVFVASDDYKSLKKHFLKLFPGFKLLVIPFPDMTFSDQKINFKAVFGALDGINNKDSKVYRDTLIKCYKSRKTETFTLDDSKFGFCCPVQQGHKIYACIIASDIDKIPSHDMLDIFSGYVDTILNGVLKELVESGIDDSDQLSGQVGAGPILQSGLDMQQLGDGILLMLLDELPGEGDHFRGNCLGGLFLGEIGQHSDGYELDRLLLGDP